MRALALAAALAAACTPHVRGLVLAGAGFRTLRAEQRVTVDTGRERRTLRALLAVEKPDRFRLRAFGPGGITLFDVVGTREGVRVLRAIRDPQESPAMARILESLGGDVRAAYGLEPPPPAGEREVRVERGGARIAIDNRAQGYRVLIDTVGQEVDVALDPTLWKE